MTDRREFLKTTTLGLTAAAASSRTQPRSGSRILLGLVGDLRIDRADPLDVFTEVKDVLRAPDLLYGNLEGPYSDHPHLAPSAGIDITAPIRNLEAYGPAGFRILTLANNHTVDGGHAAMLETMRALAAQGVKTCGAGENLAAARAPAIVEAGGNRIAFLSYASVFPMGFEGRANVPGLAPMRAYNHYHDFRSNYHFPGIAGTVESFPDREDLTNLSRSKGWSGTGASRSCTAWAISPSSSACRRPWSRRTGRSFGPTPTASRSVRGMGGPSSRSIPIPG
jgi:poly-gamma-glutamate synthesis protein (capsule biosynthesis protein)